MAKKFNITGTCIPDKHYMADISGKIEKIIALVREGEYFTINRPRQYGKTTTLFRLEQELKKDSHYLVMDISFEGIDDPTYAEQKLFIPTFLDLLKKSLAYNREKEAVDFIDSQSLIRDFNRLSNFITGFVEKTQRQVVLLIDEVDKSSNNRLFLDFLGMLRSKYLKRSEGKDHTFHSVILAGVHDVKTLKSLIRKDEEKKFNSPWNIAADFKVDLSLFPGEIIPMLEDYAKEKNVKVEPRAVAERIFHYTSGYPFLVSLLCKIIDEEILPGKEIKEWQPGDLIKAVHIALMQDSTNFESLVKNLENNPELYELVFNIIMNEKEFSYNRRNPVIHQGTLYGILKEEQGKARVHNRLYEQLIYDYMSSKLETSGGIKYSTVGSSYIREDGTLDIEKILRKFQEFMNQQYSTKDIPFLERNGRLLFLAFIKPIINGRGFDFKEVEVSEEKRLDVVITFDNQKYIVELKIWRGEAYHEEGIRQLCDYLDRQNQSKGYLLIYDIRKERAKQGAWEKIEKPGKEIYAAWV